MDNYSWSQWYPLDISSANAPVPDAPDIYEIRIKEEFGRLKGASSAVYIGSAAMGSQPSLKKRLIEQRIKNPGRYLSRAEKFIKQGGGYMEFRFAIARDGVTAKHMEARMLQQYER